MKLTKREKSRMIFEGFLTMGIMVALYLAAYVVLRWIVSSFSGFINQLWFFPDLLDQFKNNQAMVLTPLILLVLIVLIAVITYWRLKRRYRQYELKHIISELHSIAQGNYSYRIAGNYGEDMQRVVDSIHLLVDSTVQAMEEERRIEQSKDELITNVSHDIRTPLTSVIGYLGLIESRKYQNEEEAWKYAHTAYQKAKQMKALVDDLFEYTTVRQPTVPLTLVTFDMVQLLEQLAADFELEAAEMDMDITVEPEQESLEMEGDTEKLVRLFNNLLTNALKYGTEGKQVNIQTARHQQQAVLTVSNQGESLPDGAVQQLFERFYRAEESRSQEVAGTGLGLAIARGICDLHKGTIEVRVEKGWTSFIVRLPIRQQNDGQTEEWKKHIKTNT